ncbi:MAG: hypothetical protein WCK86_21910 [Planctomycetia bacterium]
MMVLSVADNRLTSDGPWPYQEGRIGARVLVEVGFSPGSGEPRVQLNSMRGTRSQLLLPRGDVLQKNMAPEELLHDGWTCRAADRISCFRIRFG